MADVITNIEKFKQKGLDDIVTSPLDSKELVRVLNFFLK